MSKKIVSALLVLSLGMSCAPKAFCSKEKTEAVAKVPYAKKQELRDKLATFHRLYTEAHSYLNDVGALNGSSAEYIEMRKTIKGLRGLYKNASRFLSSLLEWPLEDKIVKEKRGLGIVASF